MLKKGSLHRFVLAVFLLFPFFYSNPSVCMENDIDTVKAGVAIPVIAAGIVVGGCAVYCARKIKKRAKCCCYTGIAAALLIISGGAFLLADGLTNFFDDVTE